MLKKALLKSILCCEALCNMVGINENCDKVGFKKCMDENLPPCTYTHNTIMSLIMEIKKCTTIDEAVKKLQGGE